ncbi:hypothetical protein GCM10010106_12930 [Thermopolyspora flexuosa]|nr:hypothetical protein GCM10010106_12930 [Thermopolyspora flexuosa]
MRDGRPAPWRTPVTSLRTTKEETTSPNELTWNEWSGTAMPGAVPAVIIQPEAAAPAQRVFPAHRSQRVENSDAYTGRPSRVTTCPAIPFPVTVDSRRSR